LSALRQFIPVDGRCAMRESSTSSHFGGGDQDEQPQTNLDRSSVRANTRQFRSCSAAWHATVGVSRGGMEHLLYGAGADRIWNVGFSRRRRDADWDGRDTTHWPGKAPGWQVRGLKAQCDLRLRPSRVDRANG